MFYFFLGIVSYCYFCISSQAFLRYRKLGFLLLGLFEMEQLATNFFIPISHVLYVFVKVYYFLCSDVLLKGISYTANKISHFFRKKTVPAKPGKVKIVLCGKMFYFWWYFLYIMTVLTMKFQVYLIYILGDIANQSSNFCDFFLFG